MHEEVIIRTAKKVVLLILIIFCGIGIIAGIAQLFADPNIGITLLITCVSFFSLCLCLFIRGIKKGKSQNSAEHSSFSTKQTAVTVRSVAGSERLSNKNRHDISSQKQSPANKHMPESLNKDLWHCYRCGNLTPRMFRCVHCKDAIPKKKVEIRLSIKARSLPGACAWNAGKIIVAHDDSAKGGEYLKGRSAKRIAFIYAAYEYKAGYFNPWYHGALFDMFFESMDSGRETDRTICMDTNRLYRGTWQKHNYMVKTDWMFNDDDEWRSWKQRVLVFIYPMSTKDSVKKKAFNSFVDFIEKYLISGFNPGESILQKLRARYDPIQVTTEEKTHDTDGHGRHDVEGHMTRVCNMNGEIIFKKDEPFASVHRFIRVFVKSFDNKV